VAALLADDSWSSKCTPAAPASIIDFIELVTRSARRRTPASASATIGCSQSIA
jgi:hypothetical protein